MKKLFLLATLLLSSTAFSAGGESGGGGAYVRVNGEMVISDLYYKAMGSIARTPVRAVSYNDFPEAVKRATENLLRFSSYSNIPLDKQVKEGGAIYFLVPKELEAQAMCNKYVPDVHGPAHDIVQFGCTNGNITYLFVDKFEKASLREQAYGILHERLWTLNPTMTQEQVVAIINGLHKSEDAYLAQKAGDLSELSSDTLEGMKRMYEAAYPIIYPTYKDIFELAPHGGRVQKGCLHDLSHDNVITVGSVINCGEGQSMFRNNVIIDSKLRGIHWLENSTLNDVEIGGSMSSKIIWSKLKRVKLRSATLSGTQESPILISNSTLNAPEVTIGQGSNLKGVSFYFLEGKFVIGENVNLNFVGFDAWTRLGEGPNKEMLRLTPTFYVSSQTLMSKSRIKFHAEKSCYGERDFYIGQTLPVKRSASAIDLDGNAFDYKVPCKSMTMEITESTDPWFSPYKG
jgi:hypothetical protein